ncbi:MAG: MBG domain-containing protein, partial [Erysipelotrichaceae bacterium]|nr:MBG domain-containing protein [Erysipelotrichaceae bacterium]
KKAKLAMTAALTISSLSSGMNYVFAQQENKVQENANTEESSIEKEEVVEEKEQVKEIQEVEENNEQKESESVERITGDVVINNANFPDPFLQQYIKDFYGKQYGEVLSESERNRLTYMDLDLFGATEENPRTDLISLEGIQYFPALEYLNCKYQSLLREDLDLRLFQSLKYVGMAGTKITDINIEGLTNLTFFDIGQTLVREGELDFSQNKSIEHIDISSTGITKLNIDGITNLTYLDYGDSGIKEEIDASNNPRLKVLNLSGINSNGHINVDYPLIELHAYNAGLYSLDVSNNKDLTYLGCSNNSLTWLDIGKNPNLVTVNKSDSLIDLGALESSFNITNVTEAFEGIDPARVTVVSGANYNPATGEVSGYRDGTPIKYTYDAGTMANGVPVILNVTLTFTVKIPTTITLQYSDKQYTGNPVPLPTNNEYTTTGGSTGNVTFKWYDVNDTTTEISAPINVGEYKVKAFLSATNTHGAAESDFVDFCITPASSSITIYDDLSKPYDGNPVVAPTNVETTGSDGNLSFEWYTADGTKLAEAPAEVGNYKVKAILAGDDNYAGAEVEKAFTISQTAVDQITVEITNDITREYREGQVIENPEVRVTLNGSEFTNGTITFEWYKQGETTPLASAPMNAGSYEVVAKLEGTANYASAQSAKKAFTIRKVASTITINDDLSKVYDGQPVSNPSTTQTGSSGAVSFEWYTEDGTKLAEAPREVGNYKVKAILAEDNNYHGAEVEKAFTIRKAESTLEISYAQNSFMYGSEVPNPTVTTNRNEAEVKFRWYRAEAADTALTEKPTEIGDYLVEAYVEENENYLEQTTNKLSFAIRAGLSTIAIHDDLNKEYDGQPVEEPTNVETTGSTGAVSFEWYAEDGTKLQEAPVEVGNYKVKAILAGDDNYAGAEVEKAFTISQTAVDQITVEITNDITREYREGQVIENPEVRVTLNGSEFTNGTITFEWYKQGETTPLASAPMNAGSYEVVAKLEGTANYASAQSAKKAFTIRKAESTLEISYEQNSFIYGGEVPNPIATTNRNEAEVKFRWYRADTPDTALTEKPTEVGEYLVEAYIEENENYLEKTTNKLSFAIRAGSSTIAIHDDLNKEYDGQPVEEPTNVGTTGSTGAVSFEWYAEDGTKLQEAPVEVGNYKVKAILAGDDNYAGAETEAEFSISKASNAWTTELSMQRWVYGEEANTPQAEAQFGTIRYTYSTSEDGSYTEEVPSDAGTYWVKAVVEGTDNYEGLEAKVSFTIEKANSSITIDTDLNKVYDGQPVSKPSITQTGSQSTPVYEWYVKDKGTARTDTWTKLAEAPVEVGSYKLVVSVAEDTNYHGATAEVEFSIKVAPVVVPTPPYGGIIVNPDGGEIVVKPGDNIESNGPVVENPDGSITFPEGGTVTKPDGSEEVIQPGGVLKPNKPVVVPTPPYGGIIVNPDGGEIVVKP